MPRHRVSISMPIPIPIAIPSPISSAPPIPLGNWILDILLLDIESPKPAGDATPAYILHAGSRGLSPGALAKAKLTPQLVILIVIPIGISPPRSRCLCVKYCSQQRLFNAFSSVFRPEPPPSHPICFPIDPHYRKGILIISCGQFLQKVAI